MPLVASYEACWRISLASSFWSARCSASRSLLFAGMVPPGDRFLFACTNNLNNKVLSRRKNSVKDCIDKASVVRLPIPG